MSDMGLGEWPVTPPKYRRRRAGTLIAAVGFYALAVGSLGSRGGGL